MPIVVKKTVIEARGSTAPDDSSLMHLEKLVIKTLPLFLPHRKIASLGCFAHRLEPIKAHLR